MTDPYEEILEGEVCLRLPPSARHEEILQRIHERVVASMTGVMTTKLLPPRSMIQITRETKVRPDLALVTVATHKLWLAAEIVNSGDHSTDTVLKKTIYEEAGLPRLWMIDPRYDNVEVYHGSQHGLTLRQILAVQEVLSEGLLPEFRYVIAELFKM
jgi:Uma2 family endonuclease